LSNLNRFCNISQRRFAPIGRSVSLYSLKFSFINGLSNNSKFKSNQWFLRLARLNKHQLNFDLLSDEDHSIAEKYGVWELKKFMGKEFMGVVRTSFVIDKEGRLRHIMDKVNTKTHDQDLLKILCSGI